MRAERERLLSIPSTEELKAEVERLTDSAADLPSLSSLTQLAEATHQRRDIAGVLQPLWHNLDTGDDVTVSRCLAVIDVLCKHGSAAVRAEIEVERAELQSRKGMRSAEGADEKSTAARVQQAAADFSVLRAHLESQLRLAKEQMQEEQTRRLSGELSSFDWVKEREATLRALVDDQQSEQARRKARAAVMQDEVSCAYFHCFQLVLVDVMTGCKAVHSGWVSQGYNNKKDWLLSGLGLVLDNLPVSIPGSSVLTSVLQYANDLPKMHAVNAMAAFCISHNDWEHFVAQLALLLAALRQVKIVEAHDKWKKGEVPTGLNKAKAALKAAERQVKADDIDSPMKQLADDDARRLCWSVMKGRITPKTLPMDVRSSLNERALHELLQTALQEITREEKQPYAPQPFVEAPAVVVHTPSATQPPVTPSSSAPPTVPPPPSDAGVIHTTVAEPLTAPSSQTTDVPPSPPDGRSAVGAALPGAPVDPLGSASKVTSSSPSASSEVTELREQVKLLREQMDQMAKQMKLLEDRQTHQAKHAQWQDCSLIGLAQHLGTQLELPLDGGVDVHAAMHRDNGKSKMHSSSNNPHHGN